MRTLSIGGAMIAAALAITAGATSLDARATADVSATPANQSNRTLVAAEGTTLTAEEVRTFTIGNTIRGYVYQSGNTYKVY